MIKRCIITFSANPSSLALALPIPNKIKHKSRNDETIQNLNAKN